MRPDSDNCNVVSYALLSTTLGQERERAANAGRASDLTGAVTNPHFAFCQALCQNAVRSLGSAWSIEPGTNPANARLKVNRNQSTKLELG